MTHSKQAAKRDRQNENRQTINKTVRTRMKTAIKGAATAEAADRPKALAEAMKRIDKAGKSHAIHANAAARYKSRLAKAQNKAAAT